MIIKTLVATGLVLALGAATASGLGLGFHQVGGTGATADAGAGFRLGFTLGEALAGSWSAGPVGGNFGFWKLPGGIYVPVGILDEPVPTASQIFQNYPNPIHGSTTLAYRIGADKAAVATPVRLDVFDVAGRRVATLVNEIRSPGDHQVRWDGRDAQGRAVASGVYFARFRAGDLTSTVRMLRIR